MRKLIILFGLILVLSQASAQWSFDLESGLAFQSYNDVRIPNETGTTFSFTGDFRQEGTLVPLRFRVGFTFGEKNHLFAFAAPLAIDYEGEAPEDISFQQTIFPEGQTIEGFYKFNSFRLTYRRDLVQTETWTLGLGFTAKIRDARVQLTSGDLSDKKDDLGFVPLLHILAEYRFETWSLFLEGDGLAGGPGRAFDYIIGGLFPLREDLALKAGYRLLEGGADVSDVYNFTLINSAAIGFIWKL